MTSGVTLKMKRITGELKRIAPYDNIKAQHYPHILVTTGLHDSQVQYWNLQNGWLNCEILNKVIHYYY